MLSLFTCLLVLLNNVFVGTLIVHLHVAFVNATYRVPCPSKGRLLTMPTLA